MVQTLLLVPVQLTVTEPVFPDGLLYSGWLDSENILTCPHFQIIASMPDVLGTSGSLNILQDIQATYTVYYTDGSYTQCSLPHFMADYANPLPAQYTSFGYQYATSTDHPQLGVATGNPGPRNYLSEAVITGTVRDFAVIQSGTASPQVVAQVNWRFALDATFAPSPTVGGTSQFLTTVFQLLDPPVSGTNYVNGVNA